MNEQFAVNLSTRSEQLFVPTAENLRKLFGIQSKRYYPIRDETLLLEECKKDRDNLMKIFPNLREETFFEDLEKRIKKINKKISLNLAYKAVNEFRFFSEIYNKNYGKKNDLNEKIRELAFFYTPFFEKVINLIGYKRKDSKFFKIIQEAKNAYDFFDQSRPDYFLMVQNLEIMRMFIVDFEKLLDYSIVDNLVPLLLRYDFKPDFKSNLNEIEKHLSQAKFSKEPFSFEKFNRLFSLDSERFFLYRKIYCMAKSTNRHMMLRSFAEEKEDYLKFSYLKGNLILEESFNESEYILFIEKMMNFLRILQKHGSDVQMAQDILDFEITFLSQIETKFGLKKRFGNETLSFKILSRIRNLKKIAKGFLLEKVKSRLFFSEVVLQTSFISNFVIACKLGGYQGFPYILWRYGVTYTNKDYES